MHIACQHPAAPSQEGLGRHAALSPQVDITITKLLGPQSSRYGESCLPSESEVTQLRPGRRTHQENHDDSHPLGSKYIDNIPGTTGACLQDTKAPSIGFNDDPPGQGESLNPQHSNAWAKCKVVARATGHDAHHFVSGMRLQIKTTHHKGQPTR